MLAGSLKYDTKLETKNFENGLKDLKSSTIAIGNLMSDAFEKVGSEVLKLGSKIVGLGKQALNSYADYEQLVGGVKKLFGDDFGEEIIGNASKAFKTAGISANEYMQTVTSFSASLIRSLDGDTEKATQIADMAIQDMSDNANTFGTDMQSVQAVYQSLARNQFMLLDNLKLGYAGTKEGAEQMIADANAIKEANGEMGDLTVDSYADIIEAIHIAQKQQRIYGTTSKEAFKTISGSINMMRASWQNLITGIGDDTADFDELINNFVESIGIMFENILPRVDLIIDGIVNLIMSLGNIIAENLPAIFQKGMDIINNIILGIQTAMPTLMPIAIQTINILITSFISMLPEILKMGIQVIVSLINGITEQMDTLIPIMVDAVILIVNTLLDNIDLLIDAGVELTIALLSGIIDATPRLIDEMPRIIIKIVEALVRNFPKIIEAGFNMMIKMISGIDQGKAHLKEAGKRIVDYVIVSIANLLDEFKKIGENIINGVWQGIVNAGERFKQKVKNFFKNIVDSAQSALGIGSPSKVFAKEVGKWIPEGVAVGIEANTNSVDDAINEINDDIINKMRKAVNIEIGKTSLNGLNASVNDMLSANATFEGINNNNLYLDGEKVYENQQKIVARKNLQYGGVR